MDAHVDHQPRVRYIRRDPVHHQHQREAQQEGGCLGWSCVGGEEGLG